MVIISVGNTPPPLTPLKLLEGVVEGGLKGVCHTMNDLFEVSKSQIRTFCICADFFEFFWCLVMEKKIKIKVFV
jgi:hypothetical protein